MNRQPPTGSTQDGLFADYGTGYNGINSIESLSASVDGTDREHDLWLHRTRDSRREAAVVEWAKAI